jgi:hypothetical protein
VIIAMRPRQCTGLHKMSVIGGELVSCRWLMDVAEKYELVQPRPWHYLHMCVQVGEAMTVAHAPSHIRCPAWVEPHLCVSAS